MRIWRLWAGGGGSVMVAIPTQVVEVGEGTLRVELMTGEVVGTESLAVTCWMLKYMA